MTSPDERSKHQDDLRRRAEVTAQTMPDWSREHLATLSPEAILRVLHELHVHQIELEMQAEELRRAQLEIEAARQRYLDLYNHAPVGYCTLSRQGVIVQANLTAAVLLGVPPEALKERLLSEFILPADHAVFAQRQRLLLATGTPQSCEVQMLTADRRSFWACFTITLAHDVAGAPLVRLVLSDITPQKQAEAEKIRLEAQLQQASRLESVGRLAGGVAHDFNNMLGVILGHCEIALRQVDPAQPIHDSLMEITGAARRSADLTRQLLAFARKQTVAPRPLDLNDTVTQSLNLLRRLIGENIKLELTLAPNLWPIKMDPSQVDQILTNLCLNARDAILGVGTIAIETSNCTLDGAYCATHALAHAGEFVRLVVRDDGDGMDNATLAQVFDPFFTTKGVGKGTGLGLATVYGAIRQNGGLIAVTSVPSQGTTFTIHLPRCQDEVAVGSPVSAPQPVPGGHETILLVEDEATLLRLTAKVLTTRGYVVLCANSPGEAIALAVEHAGEIDLLVTDVLMPQMNGQELANALLPRSPGMRCLFMSGYTADIIAQQGILDEGVHFLQKPFSTSALLAQVRAVLGDRP